MTVNFIKQKFSKQETLELLHGITSAVLFKKVQEEVSLRDLKRNK